MANLYIDAILRSDGVKRGAAEVESSIGAMASAARAAMAAVAVGSIVNEMSKLYTEAARDEQAFMRMEVQLRRFGASSQYISSVTKEIEALRRSTAMDDEELATSIKSLATMTGDLAGARENLGLVTDVAATFSIDLATATKIVGNAMMGEGRQLGMLLPEVKELVRANSDLQGTAEGAAVFMGILAEKTAGMAETLRNSKQGSLDGFKSAWGELRESVMKSPLGQLIQLQMEDAAAAMNKATAAAEELRKAYPGPFAQDPFLGQQTSGYQMGPGLQYQAPDGAYDVQNYPGGIEAWESERARDRRIAAMQTGDFGESSMSPRLRPSRGAYGSTNRALSEGPGTGMEYDSSGWDRMMERDSKWTSEFIANRERMTGEATAMFTGMFNNIEGGWKDVMGSMLQSFRDILTRMVAEALARRLISAILGVPTGGGGGGSGGGMPGFGALMGDKSFGQAAAQDKALAWRGSR